MHFGLIRRGHSKTGGAENYLLRLASALTELEHEVTVFGSPGWPMNERPAGTFVSVPGRSPVDFSSALKKCSPTTHCDVAYSLERVESCHFYRAGDGVHAAWLERRKVMEPWWKPAWRKFDKKHRELLSLERRMLRSPDLRGVVANSNLVARELKEYHGLSDSQVHVVYNGLPKSEMGYYPEMRRDARARLQLAPDDLAIAFVGTGWDRKGLGWAIQAVELCARKTKAPLRLIVAGRGSPQDYSHSRTVFLGPVRPVRPLYMAADLFILPTIYDPFSNATLEAFAAGLPVLTTSANGVSEILEGLQDGAVVENGWEVTKLVEGLEQLLPLVGNEQGRHERAVRASRYTMDRNLQETLQVLTQAPASAAAPA